MSYSRLELESSDGILHLWLNRPEKRNALDRTMVDELYDAITNAAADDSVRAIVIGGRGSAFCAGADLAYLEQMADFTMLDNVDDSSALARTLEAIYTIAKPVIARVHGPAIAGGCGLATICDVVVAAPSAKFGYTEVRIGFVPAIVMAFLVRKVPSMAVRELLLSGRIVGADEALRRGLVTTVVTSDDGADEIERLDAHIASITSEFVAASASAIALTKQMLTALDGMPLRSALDYAARMNAMARMTPDCQSGIRRFLDRT